MNGDWWYRNIVEPGKLPLLLALAALVATFLIIRSVTHLIRAGKGPFRNVSAGGVHVHHVVPGVILATFGGFCAIGAPGSGGWKSLAAVLFGIGTGLVLDEFALVLHLHDVYWSEQGRVSVETTFLTAAVVGMALVGILPVGVDDVTGSESAGRFAWAAVVVANLVFVGVCFAKGKFRAGVVGIFVPVVAELAAWRLARPSSVWAEHYYREQPEKRRRALDRAGRRRR